MREYFLQISSAVVFAIAYPMASETAAAADWNGSYAADGSCYCIGQLPSSISSKIIPTPVGGKTVSQICQRIGQGPGLARSNGLFNYPFYSDAQCGHGPYVKSTQDHDPACAGTMGGGDQDCLPAGPEWDLKEVFSSKPIIAAARSNDGGKEDSNVIKQSPAVGGDALTISQKASAEPNVATTKKIDSAAGDGFAGKSVTIGGQRYLQAHADIAANGGRPGSRIVLDDLVYLRDDALLNPEDLYKGPSVAAAKPAVIPEANAPEKVAEESAVAAANAAKALERERRVAALKAKQQEQARIALQAKRRQQKQAALAKTRQQSEAQTSVLIAQEKERIKQLELQQAATASEQQVELDKQAAQRKIELEKQAATKRQLERERIRKSEQQAIAQASQAKKKKPSRSDASLAAALPSMGLPGQLRTRAKSYDYFEAMPTSYDVGGNGLTLEGSGERRSRFHFLGRLGISDSYQEVMVGGGYYLTPASASHVTVAMLAGVEFGSFELEDDVLAPGVMVDYNDTGLHLGLSSRVTLTRKFELKAGVGYSTFFKGDASLFGGAYYHITPRLDAMSRFEIGDNDSFGVGIRYFY